MTEKSKAEWLKWLETATLADLNVAESTRAALFESTTDPAERIKLIAERTRILQVIDRRFKNGV